MEDKEQSLQGGWYSCIQAFKNNFVAEHLYVFYLCLVGWAMSFHAAAFGLALNGYSRREERGYLPACKFFQITDIQKIKAQIHPTMHEEPSVKLPV